MPSFDPATRAKPWPQHSRWPSRLTGGDPSIWKTVRALKMRPGTLRVRVAGDSRLLFETGPADTLLLVDFILCRDLDRWLAAGSR